MYKKVELKDGKFVNMENDVRELWKEKDIIHKNLEMNKGERYFTFYDGPPTANGKPHIGHVLTRVIKDIIPRYRVMKGYYVPRKAGWDTHGLPVEVEVEKHLGISGKQEIEEYGIEPFIKECKNSVFTYVKEWEKMSDEVAYWVDMEHPYVTYHNDYIESEWWALKQLWDKGLLYEGFKVVPYCPRCGTALSSHEVGQSYKQDKALTAILKFKVEDKDDTYILAWTTTPWTLPSNLALCVNKAYDYAEFKVKVSKEDEEDKYENYILAKDLAPTILKDYEYEIVKEFKGEELLGTKYEQLLPFAKPENGKAFEVIHGDYVSLTDGTGIVHIAPAYGEDDSFVCKQNGIGFVNLVDKQGKFTKEVTPWAGRDVMECNKEICIELQKQGKIFATQTITHDYPHCWRCDTPLLYYPRDSWFVNMTSIRDNLLKNNDKIHWMPDTIRTGRFGKFLENVVDWGISRDRYWGTPLPIWKCECGHKECIGSIEELKEKGVKVPDDIELHKPYIDNVELTCPECGKEMTRYKEVIDCWFDSGSMPFAQHHYPFENKEEFKKQFPANFISEAQDQTRGWFYSLLAISTALFDEPSYLNCIVLGLVLDSKGIKMSKHLGNVVDPFSVLETVGADATRWHFYTSSMPWLPTRFSKKDVEETQRRFLSTLWNVYSFFVLYAEIDKFDPSKYTDFKSENVMDKWIISKLNTLVKDIDEKLEKYQITEAATEIESFVNQVSNWYVRRNRTRFWGSGMEDDKIGAYTTLYTVLTTLSKLLAPFTPFIAEEIYQNLVANLDKNAPESVHLCTWPEYHKELVDPELEKEMEITYKVVELGRSARNSANVKNRQPLKEILVSIDSLPKYYEDIITDELNIKKAKFGADMSEYVHFEIKPNLPVLGKAYGKLIPQIRKAISEENQLELAKIIQGGKEKSIKVDGEEIVLNEDNLLITMQGKEGFAFAGENELGILLDTVITKELEEEGYIRELLSRVQTMRKDSNFEVMDNINIYLEGNKELEEIVKKNEDKLMKATLCKKIAYDEDRDDYTEIEINGQKINLSIEKI